MWVFKKGCFIVMSELFERWKQYKIQLNDARIVLRIR